MAGNEIINISLWITDCGLCISTGSLCTYQEFKMDNFKMALEAIEKAASKQTAYWNILSAVSFGAIGAASSGKIEILFLIIGYILFGISNLFAIDGCQEEIVFLKKHCHKLTKEHTNQISETHLLILNTKRIVSRRAVFLFHIFALILTSAIMYFGYTNSILNTCK